MLVPGEGLAEPVCEDRRQEIVGGSGLQEIQMIELTWVADALRVGGLLFVLVYYGAAALLIYKAARWEKPLWQKAAVLAVVVIAFGYLPVSGYLEQRERRSYAKAAWDRFNKYCAEKAGAKISKTVSNVESILIYAPAVRRPDLTFMKGDPFAGRRQASEEQIAGAFLESGMSSIGFRRLFNSVEVERPDKPGETTIVRFESTPNGKIKQVNTRPPAGELGLYEVPEENQL